MNQTVSYILLLLPLMTACQPSKKFHSKWKSPPKGTLALKIGIPEGNFFYLNKGERYGKAAGFLGLSVGTEYYINDKYNINADVGVAMDYMVPFPAPICYMGGYDKSSALFCDLQIGTDWRRFHFDAGIQYLNTIYVERETVALFPHYYDTLIACKQQGNLGLALNTYFRLTKTFNIGINYYPTFLVFDAGENSMHYGHLLFFDLIFRINVSRRRAF
jgi:hypothetical protein